MAGKQREKPLVRLIRAVLTWWRPCYVLLLLVGFGGFLALPMFERWIKFDEKSLMVGGAHATLRCELLSLCFCHCMPSTSCRAVFPSACAQSCTNKRWSGCPVLAACLRAQASKGVKVHVPVASYFHCPSPMPLLHTKRRSSAGAVDAGKAIAEHVHAAQHAPRSAGHHTQLLSLLKAHMESMSLEAYTSFGGLLPQQPTPAGSGHGANAAANSSRSCTNLHGILRSPLGDGKESIVLVTPMALTIGRGVGGLGW